MSIGRRCVLNNTVGLKRFILPSSSELSWSAGRAREVEGQAVRFTLGKLVKVC